MLLIAQGWCLRVALSIAVTRVLRPPAWAPRPCAQAVIGDEDVAREARGPAGLVLVTLCFLLVAVSVPSRCFSDTCANNSFVFYYYYFLLISITLL